MIHPERPDIAISLSAPDEQDRLARNVSHGQGGADLVVLPNRPEEVLAQEQQGAFR